MKHRVLRGAGDGKEFVKRILLLSLLDSYLCHDVAAFPAEQRLVKRLELEPQLSHVIRNAKTVGECSQPIDDIFVGVSDQALPERILPVEDEVGDAFDAVFRENSFLVEMHNPVVWVEDVDAIFQTILKRSRLEHRAGFGFVIFRHNDLTNSSMLRDVYRLISDDLNEKVLEARVETSVHVPHDIRLHQVGVVAASDNSDADEWRKQRRPFKYHFVGKGVVEDEPKEVAHHLRQCEDRQEPHSVEEYRPCSSVLRPWVDCHEVVLVNLYRARSDEEECHETAE